VSYTLRAIANPISVTAISGVICWMIGRHDYFGAGFLTVMMLALIADVASCRYVRVRLDRASERRARDRRVIARLDSLCAMTEARRLEYIELHNLVDEIDGGRQTKLELQELLDRFVKLAAQHARCLQICGAHTPALRTQRVADHLDTIGELIRLVAGRLAWARATARRA
jgi:hypothetical protein